MTRFGSRRSESWRPVLGTISPHYIPQKIRERKLARVSARISSSPPPPEPFAELSGTGEFSFGRHPKNRWSNGSLCTVFGRPRWRRNAKPYLDSAIFPVEVSKLLWRYRVPSALACGKERMKSIPSLGSQIYFHSSSSSPMGGPSGGSTGGVRSIRLGSFSNNSIALFAKAICA